jgi:hypothetical protein
MGERDGREGFGGMVPWDVPFALPVAAAPEVAFLFNIPTPICSVFFSSGVFGLGWKWNESLALGSVFALHQKCYLKFQILMTCLRLLRFTKVNSVLSTSP